MRRIHRIHLAELLLLAGLMGIAGPAGAQTGNPPAMPSSEPTAPAGARLVVTYHDGPDSPAAIAANHTVGARVLRPLGQPHAAVVILPAGANVAHSVATLRAQPGVMAVQVDGRLGVQPVRGPRIGD